MGEGGFYLPPQAWTWLHSFISLQLLPCVCWEMNTAFPSCWAIPGACSCSTEARVRHPQSLSLSECQMAFVFFNLFSYLSYSAEQVFHPLTPHAIAVSAAAQRWCEALALPTA